MNNQCTGQQKCFVSQCEDISLLGIRGINIRCNRNTSVEEEMKAWIRERLHRSQIVENPREKNS